MSAAVFRGIFTIPATPFAPDWSVDWAGLASIVEFCVGCGAHGIVWPVNASGFGTLSDAERLEGFARVVEATAGRIPVVLGVQGVHAGHAALFARRAREVGADAVIAMAPYVTRMQDADNLLAYYRAIARAAGLPVILQNHSVGSDLSVELLGRILQANPEVQYIKEETFPVTHKITALMQAEVPTLKGVFGGAGGRYMLLEYARGCAGQMPGCHVTDVMVRYWNALEEDDLPEAKRLYGLLAPLYALETQCPGVVYKEVLRRRGVIASARTRNASAGVMDAYDHRALDDILRDLEPEFTWRAGGALRSGPEAE
ncbi:MAG: dihydrodipicolinate synthase family protein [Anaerolineae bacterium]|jgi:dihydrodipicolinate synthase/N-acetylneuraminate lyase|nr:dihydrodipicolinate synthase family protein [Chloroflexota bacterium]